MGILDAPVTPASIGAAPQARPTDILVGSRVYDQQRNIYGLAPRHLRKFRAKLAAAAAGVGICEIACVGDSIVLGQGVSYQTQSWPAVARERIVVATGAKNSTGWVAPVGMNSGALDPRWTKTGTFQGGSGVAAYFHPIVSSTAASTATFVSDKAGTVAEVYYSDKNVAFTVAIDGGAPVTVTPGDTNAMMTYTVTGLTDAVHTIVVTQTGAGLVYVYAARVRSTAGLSVSNWGFSNSKAVDWNTASFYQNINYVASTAPALSLLSLGTNDVANAVGTAAYKTNMTVLIDKLKAVGDVILVAPIPLNMDMSLYRRALYELAESKDVPVLDLWDRWVNFSTANTLAMYADGVHPTPTGYADMGLAIGQMLSM